MDRLRRDPTPNKRQEHDRKKAGSAALPVPGGPIHYTQTQVRMVVPEVLRRQRLMDGENNLAACAAYNILRRQVLQRMTANGWTTLAITSPGPGEGKTLTIANLAVTLAREVQWTVLLADFDLRRPSVHRYFGIEPRYGVSDVLCGDVPLHEALIHPGLAHLVILPGRIALANSSELLASPKATQLATELKARYPSRLVLFDLPPLLENDDALAFAPRVDAMLLVVEDGKTSKEELKHALGLLKSTHIIGTVLNRSHDTLANGYY